MAEWPGGAGGGGGNKGRGRQVGAAQGRGGAEEARPQVVLALPGRLQQRPWPARTARLEVSDL